MTTIFTKLAKFYYFGFRVQWSKVLIAPKYLLYYTLYTIQDSRKDHETEIQDMQSKMQQDMLKLKERLNSLQTQAIIQRAHDMNKETEVSCYLSRVL